jgi:predicted SprT family Zn-dependent metalloprotease
MLILDSSKGEVTKGYYHPERYVYKYDKSKVIGRIALNPQWFLPGRENNCSDIVATLVHQMCHALEIQDNPKATPTHHSKKWGEMMEKIGLMPSDTGNPDGKRTGKKMSQFVLAGGQFEKMCQEEKFDLSWADRLVSSKLTDSEVYKKLKAQGLILSDEKSKKATGKGDKSKTKYSCKCNPPQQFWAKPGLKSCCPICKSDFLPESSELDSSSSARKIPSGEKRDKMGSNKKTPKAA